MITVINGCFSLSKDGKLVEEICESIEDCVKEVVIRTYNGDEHCLSCDDFVTSSAKQVSHDTHEEDTFKDGIIECYKLDESKDLENSDIIKLKGICYRVVRINDLIILHNEINKSAPYQCKTCELKELLESVDKEYEVYRKEYFDL